MDTPSQGYDPEEERDLVFDLSPELEAELIRRARENGTDAATEAARILEDHARNAGETD